MVNGLAGKACIVTGASRRIGRATSVRLGSAGAHVLAVGRDEAALRGTVELAGGERLIADLADPSSPSSVVAACLDAFGRVDVLVNNAGTAQIVAVENLQERDFELQW